MSETSTKTVEATITTDPQKLWSCENMRKNHPQAIGKLPPTSGQKVILEIPGRAPSPFCSAKRAWHVSHDSYKIGFAGTMLCEHQVDGI